MDSKSIQSKNIKDKKIIVKGKKQIIKKVKEVKNDNTIEENIKSGTIKILSNDDTKINGCIHISDLHIHFNPHNSDRFDEFTQVFNNLYKQIDEQLKLTPNIIIVITGDIAHRARLYGKEINFIEQVFNELANRCPIITIFGNHDFINHESSELFYLVPIMRNKKTKHEIHFLLDSGFYLYNNLLFGVTTVFSKEILKNDFGKDNNYTTIGLYHGLIYSDNIRTILPNKENYITIEEFNSYDICMFGDLHNPVFHDAPKNTRGYAGSILAVTKAEQYLHGYLYWDFINKKGEFREIKNSYGFVTLEIDENGIKDMDKINIPKNVKMDVYYKNIDYEKAKEITKKLEEKYNISIEPQFDLNLKNINTNEKNILVDKLSELKSKEGLCKVISEYIQNNEKGSDALEMQKIINEIIGELKYKKEKSLKKIKLVKLEFDNFFSYNEGNIINFEDMKGSTVNINGNNGIGKSSIFDVILVALFGKSTRGNVSDYINARKDYMKTDIIFQVNNDNYRLTRYRKRAIKTLNKKTRKVKKDKGDKKQEEENYVKLYKNDKLVPMDNQQSSAGYGEDDMDAIKSIIGTYSDFIKSCYMLQNYYDTKTNFFNMSDTQQKEMLLKFLNLDILLDIADGIKSKQNEYNMELVTINKQYKVKSLKEIENKLTQIEKEYKENLKNFNNNRHELNELKEERDQLIKNITENNLKLKNKDDLNEKEYDKLLEEQKILDNKIEQINKTINKNLKEKEKIIKEIPNLTEEQNNLETNKLIEELILKKTNTVNLKKIDKNIVNKLKKDNESKQNIVNHLINEINNLQKCLIKEKNIKPDNYKKYLLLEQNEKILDEEINKIGNENKNYSEKLNLNVLGELEYNNKCKLCKQNKIKIDNIEYNKIFNDNNKIIETKRKEISSIKTEKELVEKDYIKYIENQNIVEKNLSINNQIKEKELELNLNKSEIKLLEESIKIEEKKLEEYEINENNVKYNLHLDKEIEKYKELNKNKRTAENKRKEILRLENEISMNEKQKYELNNKMDIISKKIEKCKEMENQIQENKKIKEKNIENQNNLTKINNKIEILETDIQNLNKKNAINDKLIEELKTNYKIYEENENKKQVCKKLHEYMTKEENSVINAILSKRVFPTLEEIINGILLQICDFRIKMFFENKKTLRIMKIYKSGIKVNVDTVSCSENTILELTFKICLMYLNSLTRVNIFVCDEIFSVFDANKLDILINKLFTCLKKYFDTILIVSHIDDVKMACDNQYTITKDTEGYSHIVMDKQYLNKK